MRKKNRNISSFNLIKLPTFADPRGSLTVIDKVLPFQIERIYWIYGADGEVRGGHRHHRTTQALIALSGAVSVYMYDGVFEETIELTKPDECLIVEPKDWHGLEFGANSILLIVSSHAYDKDDYITEPY